MDPLTLMALATVLGALGTSITTAVNDNENRKATAEANARNEAFTREINATEMAYNSAEAEKERQWQEYMSGTSVQRAMRDYEAAGLNPLLAVPGGASYAGGSTASAALSVPQVKPVTSSAASVAAGIGSFTDMIEKMGMLMLISKVTGNSAKSYKNPTGYMQKVERASNGAILTRRFNMYD